MKETSPDWEAVAAAAQETRNFKGKFESFVHNSLLNR